MSTHALIVVDMQNAYFNNDSLAAVKPGLVAACNQLIEAFMSASLPVLLVRTQHKRDRSTWTLNMLDDGRGYLFNDQPDAAYVDGLLTDGTIEILKTRDSAFHDTNLGAILKKHAIDHIFIAGISTHSCILYTAADAYAENYRVTLAQDAIASHDPTYHDSTLAMLEQEYRQPKLSNDAIRDMISQ
jgi:nicotinamidase-related amidase